MHSSIFNSLLYDISDEYMPFDVTQESLTEQLLMLFHEFAIHYGQDVQLDLLLTLSEEHSTDAIKIDHTRGLIFGDVNNEDLRVNITFLASNATTTKETALILEMNLQAVFNVSIQSFALSMEVNDPQIAHTVVVQDNIGMYYHDYDDLLTNILIDFAFDFNLSHSDGIDFKQKYPVLKLVNHALKYSEITPLALDDFIFGGFSWISDF